MQTNTSWGYDDLSIITRLYRKQKTLQKSYRVTYQDKKGKKDFVGAHDKNEVDEKVRELENHGHKVLDIDILKAKVYVKNPSDAPPNVKLQEGERGGHYYESSRQSKSPTNKLETNNNEVNSNPEKNKKKINVIDTNSDVFYEISDILKVSEANEILTKEYVENLVKENNINLNDVSINILQFDVPVFGFTYPVNPNEIYLPSTQNKFIKEWISDLKFLLISARYDNNEIDNISINDKRVGTIIHEIGHTKVNKYLDLTHMSSMSELRQEEYKKFSEYVKYVSDHYKMADVYSYLDEMLAEDYRQLIGGNQSKIPNRYFYKWDTIHNENYKYKEGRLNILRKMGVF